MYNSEIAHALRHLRPGAEWVLRGDDYSGLEWLDKKQSKPTEEEIKSACSDCNPVAAEYKSLTTDAEKLAFLAKRLGL